MLQIDKTSLREMREKVATKMMLFEGKTWEKI